MNQKPWLDEVGKVSGGTDELLLASSKLYSLFNSSLSKSARLRLWKTSLKIFLALGV
jgi:hypothetical protein